MNCINCGALLTDAQLDYCPHCGYNVLIQKKVDYLSKYYYNQGLEKASIRDLSGAISCLKQSLTYNKANIQARNLLGLVYFETGEVVAALSEWVISKNLQPNRNLASDYINKLQANSNKLEAINETIKKYNHALALCREGHEDMAAIQLKKILSQNSKLIKGYHLLALIQMKNNDWNKARKILKKAVKIDKTNTTTLRFLREIDEQTGVTTKLEQQGKGLFRGNESDQGSKLDDHNDAVVHSPYREHTRLSLFFTMVLGVLVGVAAFGFLAVPAIRQRIYREANQQIVTYSESLASQGAELSKAQTEAQQSDTTVEETSTQLQEEQTRSESYEALMNAYIAQQGENLDEAAVQIQKVHASVLSDSLKGIYTTICQSTGVTGIEDTGSTQTTDTGTTDTGTADTTEDTTEDTGSYDSSESADSGTEDSSYDSGYDSSYDSGYDSSYDENYDESYDDSYDESGEY